jgi:hypothetical protein
MSSFLIETFGIGIILYVGFLLMFFGYGTFDGRLKLCGWGWKLDLGLMILMLAVFGGTGIERLGNAAASILISLTIISYRWLYGWKEYHLATNSWTRFAGRLT